MKAMVLAAGRGSRLAPLTNHTPKPLLEIGARSLLEHALIKLESAGFDTIVVNVCWLAEQIRVALARRQWRSGYHLSEERNGRLETGGGICQALPWLGQQAFAVVNADVYSDFDFARLAARVQAWPAGQLAHLVLVPNPEHHPQGDFGLNQGKLTDRPAYTFAGLSVLHPKLFTGRAAGEVFALAPLLFQAAREGRASAELHQGYWNDVGTPERLARARQDQERLGLV